MAAAIAAETACFTDWRTVLAPGEVATVAVIAGDRAQARTVFRYVRALISETSLLAGMIVLTSGLTVLPALTLGPIVESLAP